MSTFSNSDRVYRSMESRALTTFEWRCTCCGTLLGVELHRRMHLKYKDAQYVVTGRVKAVCRRCETTNETVCPRGDARGQSVVS